MHPDIFVIPCFSDLESEGELAQSASPQDDEEFEKELDQMIENIDVDDPIPDIVSYSFVLGVSFTNFQRELKIN